MGKNESGWDHIPLLKNDEARRFEMTIDGHLSKIDFIQSKDRIFLTHTEVAPELEGRGVGSSLVRRTLDQIREAQLQLAPLCPFVAAYIKRHPEYQDILAPGYRVS